MHLRRAVILSMLATTIGGCSESKRTDAEANKQPVASTCAGVGDNWRRVHPGHADADKLAPVEASACVDDSWSADAIACLTAATTAPAWETCRAKLTPAQRDTFEYRAGKARGLRAGWACDQLEGFVKHAGSCKGLSQDQEMALKEMKIAAEDAIGLMRSGMADASAARQTELRCISVHRLAKEVAGGLPCALGIGQ